jgi:hypothetical protein
LCKWISSLQGIEPIKEDLENWISVREVFAVFYRASKVNPHTMGAWGMILEPRGNTWHKSFLRDLEPPPTMKLGHGSHIPRDSTPKKPKAGEDHSHWRLHNDNSSLALSKTSTIPLLSPNIF